MGDTTGIAWSESTYNPWTGCAKVSPGCDFCYMFRDKRRFGQDPEVVVRSSARTFNRPLAWEREAGVTGRRRLVFTCSWSDFFIKEADEWRADAFEMFKRTPHLVYQILTKRIARVKACLPPDWGDGYHNVWLGVSAEDGAWWDRRVPLLRDIPAAVRFVSYEPALGPVPNPDLSGISWVITGGESGEAGVSARMFDQGWVRTMNKACRAAGVAHFVKQMGSFATDSQGELLCKPTRVEYKHLHGANPAEWPADLRVQMFPGDSWT